MDQPQGYLDTVNSDGRVVPVTIETHTIIEGSKLADNIRINLARDVPRFYGREGFCQVRSEPLAIVSGGPSLRGQLEKLRGFDKILVCGSTHDYLVRAGIIPTYAVVADGGVDDKLNLSLASEETTFLLASQCDPSLFDHLEDHHVEMWHYRGQSCKDQQEENDLLNGETSVAWGSTVTLTSICLAMMMGYQHLHFFGFDNCYADYGLTHHCGAIKGGVDYEKVPVEIGARTFITNMALLAQVNQYFRLVEIDGQFFHSTIHGDHLTSEMVKQGDPGLEKFVSLA